MIYEFYCSTCFPPALGDIQTEGAVRDNHETNHGWNESQFVTVTAKNHVWHVSIMCQPLGLACHPLGLESTTGLADFMQQLARGSVISNNKLCMLDRHCKCNTYFLKGSLSCVWLKITTVSLLFKPRTIAYLSIPCYIWHNETQFLAQGLKNVLIK